MMAALTIFSSWCPQVWRLVLLLGEACGSGRGVVWLYNRVGKAGSESLLSLLGSECHLQQLTLPAGSRAKIEPIEAAVRRAAMLYSLSERPCVVLAAHFRWLPINNTLNARYINVLRQPVNRWRSLHAFFRSHPWFGESSGRRTSANATECILEHEQRVRSPKGSPKSAKSRNAPKARNATDLAVRTCVSAHDAMMADYFLTHREQRKCAVNTVLKRYAFIGTLENRARDIPLLLMMLGVSPSRAFNVTLPHDNKAENLLQRESGNTPGVGTDEAFANAILARELWCDRAIYDAVVTRNSFLARAEYKFSDVQ